MADFFAEGSPGEWTSLSLLAAVLVAVGGFLRWWLPTREQGFETHLQSQQAAWLASRSEDRDAFREALERQQAAFAAQWEREREWLSEFGGLERQHARECLRRTQDALADVKDFLRALRDDVRALVEAHGNSSLKFDRASSTACMDLPKDASGEDSSAAA